MISGGWMQEGYYGCFGAFLALTWLNWSNILTSCLTDCLTGCDLLTEPHLVSLVPSLWLPDRDRTAALWEVCVCVVVRMDVWDTVCLVCHWSTDVHWITSQWPHPDLPPVSYPPSPHSHSSHWPVHSFFGIDNDFWFMTSTAAFPSAPSSSCLHRRINSDSN